MKNLKNYNVLAFISGLMAGVFSLFVGFFFILFSGSAISSNSTNEAVIMVVISMFIIAAAVVSIVGAVFCYSNANVGGWIMLVGVILVTIDIVIFLIVNWGGAVALLLPEAFIVFGSVVAIRTKRHEQEEQVAHATESTENKTENENK